MEVLILDGNEFLMRAVFTMKYSPRIPLPYFFLRQIFKYMKQFNPDKTVLVYDRGGSWRKGIYKEYKAMRKDFRDSHKEINWDKVFADYQDVLICLKRMSKIKVIGLKNIEGDDIIAIASQYYKNDDVIVCSQDKDFIQLLLLPNVAVYSPKLKDFRAVDNPMLELEKLIKRGDVADNIPRAKTEDELTRNRKLISLFEIPEWVTNEVNGYLDYIENKEVKQLDFEEFRVLYTYKFLANLKQYFE